MILGVQSNDKTFKIVSLKLDARNSLIETKMNSRSQKMNSNGNLTETKAKYLLADTSCTEDAVKINTYYEKPDYYGYSNNFKLTFSNDGETLSLVQEEKNDGVIRNIQRCDEFKIMTTSELADLKTKEKIGEFVEILSDLKDN